MNGINKTFYKFFKKTTTGLSKYIWRLKSQNINYSLSWEIICKTKSYTIGANCCYLWSNEFKEILFYKYDNLLNIGEERKIKCRQRLRYLYNRFHDK